MEYFSPDALERLKANRKVSHTGVTHGFVDHLFKPEVYEELIATFPDVSTFKLVDKQSGGGHKRFYVGPEYVAPRNFGAAYHMRNLPPVWLGVMKECASPEFMQKLGDAVGVEFNTMMNFGFTYGDEGCMQGPHLDGAIRPGDTGRLKGNIALLMYFNKEDDPVSATELYDLDRTTVLGKGTTMRNSMFYFVQHPNAWHGFPQVPKGHTRRLVSLTYGQEKQPVELHFDLLHSIVPLEKWRWQRAQR